MRIDNVRASRPDWYDRNPVARANSFASVGIAPHADVVRWTYTVPTGKKFNLQMFASLVQRATAAAPVGTAYNILRYTPSGGAVGGLIEAVNTSNTVGAGTSMAGGSAMIMLAGDVIDCDTADASTGGTQAYLGSMQGLEFDA